MEKINDVAIAYWRLEKWIKSANVDKKASAESSLRSIKRFLDGNLIEIDDLTGDTYDSGLAVEIVYREDDDGSPYDGIAKIIEMVKPIILQKGSVIQFGQAIIGNKVHTDDTTKEAAITVENHPLKETPKEPTDKVEIIKGSTEVISKNPALNYFIAVGIVILIILSIINLFSSSNSNNEIHEITVTDKVQEIVVDNKLLTEIKAENEYSINTINKKLLSIEKQLQTEKDEVVFVKYTIKAGDSLERICMEKNISYTDNILIIKNINLIANENKLYAGQTILLPKTN